MNKTIIFVLSIAIIGGFFILQKFTVPEHPDVPSPKSVFPKLLPLQTAQEQENKQENEIVDGVGFGFELIEKRDNLEIYKKIENGINCYFIKPKGGGPFPVFVLNHGGYGSAELFSIGTSGKSTQNFVETGSGIFLGKKGYASVACDYTQKDLDKKKINEFKENERPGASEENIKRALNAVEIAKGLNCIDADKIFMLGNSMGGFLTVGVAQRTSDLKAAIVIVAGIKDGNPQTQADRIVEIISPPGNLVKDISCPILMLNGEIDNKVNVKYPQYLKSLLDTYGKTSKLIIYPDVGHDLLRTKQGTVYDEVFKFLDEI